MELRQLQTFVTITQTESFSRAAEVLGYTQSALTVQIRLLENELGVKLFDRMGKRVYLTAPGRQFLGHAILFFIYIKFLFHYIFIHIVQSSPDWIVVSFPPLHFPSYKFSLC